MKIYAFFAQDPWGVDLTDQLYFDSREKAEEFEKQFESNPENEVFTASGLRNRGCWVQEFDLL